MIEPPGPPLAETLAAGRDRFGGHDVLGAHLGAPDGWPAAAAFGRGEAVLDEQLAGSALQLATDRADILAARVVEAHAWGLAVRAVGTLLIGDRVPVMDPEQTFLQISPGGDVTGVAFTGGAHGLPGDPAAGVRTASGENDLLGRLHTELEAHLTPLVEALHARSGRARPALWRSCGDRLGGAFLWLGEVLGCRDEAWRRGMHCLALDAPLAGGAPFRIVEHAGIAEPTRNRSGCCLLYRIDTHPPNETCFTCPLTTEQERHLRLERRADAS